MADQFWLAPTIKPLLSPDDSFDAILALKGETFRDFQSRKTFRIERQGKGYFVKNHFAFGYMALLKTLLRGGLPVIGASTEKAAIAHLEKAGVATMKVVGFGQRGSNLATQQSFLITEELTNCDSLEDWALQPDRFNFTAKQKRILIEQVAVISRNMHNSGMNHRDFYLCHFLLERGNDHTWPHLFLIDLHRAQIRPKVPFRWLVKDLGGLYFSALDASLTRRDYLRFLKCYFGQPLRTLLTEHADLLTAVQKRADRMYQRFQRKFV